MRNKNKGFTLVELIVVLVILAILAAILVPALLGYIDRTKVTQCELNRSYFKKAITALYVDCYATDAGIADNESLGNILSSKIDKYYDGAVSNGNLLEFDGVCDQGGTIIVKDIEFVNSKLKHFEVKCTYHDNETGNNNVPDSEDIPPVPGTTVADGLTGFANIITTKFNTNTHVNGNNYYLMRASEAVPPSHKGKDAFGNNVPLRISLDDNTENKGSGKYRVLTSGNNVNNNNQGLASIFKNSIIDKADDNQDIYNEINWKTVTVNYIDVTLSNADLDSGNSTASGTTDKVNSVDGFQLVQNGDTHKTYTVFTYINGSWTVERNVTASQFGFIN